MDPRPVAGARRRDARLPARRGAALGALRDPLRPHPQGPGRVGARSASRLPVTHIPVRVDDDAVRWDVVHTLVVGTQTVASPDLIEHLKERAADKPHRYTIICPRSGDMAREAGQREPRDHARRALPGRDRRDRPADEPGAVRRDPERDRALPDRRDPDLDPRRRAVEVARGGPDRSGEGDHRPADRARRGRRAREPSEWSESPHAIEPAPERVESASIAEPRTSTTARPRPTRARGSTARRSASCSSSSRRSCCSGRSSPRTSSSASSPTTARGRPRAFELPVAVAGHEHRDPGLVELHDALGARVRSARATAAACRWA